MSKSFLGEYIRKMRKDAGVSVKELCRGLCSAQQLFAAEKGERQLNKLVQDAVMERLGVGAEDYEHLLNYSDYKRWEDRQHILHAVTFEEFEAAGELLEEYYAAYCKEDLAGRSRKEFERKLDLQFYLSMRTLLKCCTGGIREELEEGYRHALELTVPEVEQQPLARRMLSFQELNLILEAEQHRADGGRIERYREVVFYIETRKLDKAGKAKIYPKAVYFLCRKAVEGKKSGDSLNGADSDFTDAGLLKYCNRAYEVLRRGGRMCFLWEILHMREHFLENLAEQCGSRGEIQKAGRLRLMLKENKKFMLNLEQLYNEFEVRKETFEFCYLYVVREVYCVNDVIRIRRRMLQMKEEALYREICTEKTLRNIEKGITLSQRAVSDELIERLGLPRDRTKTEIMTDNPRAKELWRILRSETDSNRCDKADQLLKELRQKISTEIPCNRQFLKKEEALIKWYQGRSSEEEYCEEMRKALEITLPFGAFLKEGKKYLTNLEQICILNMMNGMDRESEELLTCICRFEEMYQPLIQAGMQENVEKMYELIMGSVGNMLRSRGEYDRSDEIIETIIGGCLRFRRAGILYDVLYGRWWNQNEREKRGISSDKKSERSEELERCIQFAEFSRKYKDAEFYKTKLAQ